MKIKNSDIFKYKLEDKLSFEIYQKWIDKSQKWSIKKLANEPSFSVVVPVYNVKDEHLEDAIKSVLNQNYYNYELILVDDNSSWTNVKQLLLKYKNHKKVKLIFRNTNGKICAATNDGIKAASNDFIVFMDCDDVIDSNTLYELGKIINVNKNVGLIYTDEDRLTEDGKYRHQPFFKPDWSPHTYYSINYTNHLTCIRKKLLISAGLLDKTYEGCQDYDITMKIVNLISNNCIKHISKVLYHWRERSESVAGKPESKPYVNEAAKRLKNNICNENNAFLEFLPVLNQYMIINKVEGNPLVSMIVSIRSYDRIKAFLSSIDKESSYKNFEIIFISNEINSVEKLLISSKEKRVRFIFDKTKKYSSLKNDASLIAKGDFLLFYTDMMKPLKKDWLSRMLGQAQQNYVGFVAPKIYYEKTKTIYSSGMSWNDNGIYLEFNNFSDLNINFNNFDKIIRNAFSAPGLCSLINKKIFIDAGKYDEKLEDGFADIDLTYRLYKKGFYTVIKNDIVIEKNNNISYKFEDATMLLYLKSKHADAYGEDPFVNRNLNRYNSFLDLKGIKQTNQHKFDFLLRRAARRFFRNKPRLKSFAKKILFK